MDNIRKNFKRFGGKNNSLHLLSGYNVLVSFKGFTYYDSHF